MERREYISLRILNKSKSMKTKTFLILLVFCLSLSSLAEDTYKLLLTDGKVWKCAIVNASSREDTVGYCTVSVCGDTIVGERVCRKICVSDDSHITCNRYIAAYEDDEKIYRVNEDGTDYFLFDFGLKKGNEINAGYVLDEDVIIVNGQSRKRLMIDSGIDGLTSESDYWIYYLVEGIGVSKDEFIKLEITTGDEYCCLLSCFENNVCVFTKEDFTQTPTGIVPVNMIRQQNTSLYNIQGKKITSPQIGEIYINDGKKYLKSW